VNLAWRRWHEEFCRQPQAPPLPATNHLVCRLLLEKKNAEPASRQGKLLERGIVVSAEQPPLSMFTTTITEAEILYGLRLLPEGRRRRALETAILPNLSTIFPDACCR